ncbi:MAG: hypothetical protein J6M34_00690 [Clostridia bacterium]|nr:hypothetical protein [Clostridia bacterium]
MKKVLSFALALVLICGLLSVIPFSAAGDTGVVLDNLTWEKGSYYGATPNTGHATTRRYTVIPCDVGDKLYFTMPSTNWRLYIYPADANGPINWTEPVDGTEYTVSEISGRTPTELRITACPEPDGTLTDPMWANFDVVISKKSVKIKDSTGREWFKGSYYGATPNTDQGTTRRYTVIPCEEGDVFDFDMPSTKWRLYIYPADANGSINWTEPVDGTKYTVQEISGRMPTELRITACPNPDGTFTDEMWADFDVVITKETKKITDSLGREWFKGSYYGATPNLDHATTRRYTVIPCAEGDVVTFTMPSTNWRLYVYPADATGSINWVEATNGMEYTVQAISGRMPTELRITACPNPDGNLTDEMWKNFDVKIEVSKPAPPAKDLFEEATWNKGSFYDAAAPNTGHSTTRRYTVIPCEEGQQFTFNMPSSNWRIYVYPADANGSIGGDWFELTNGMKYTIKTINGRVPTNLRITVCPNPDGNLTDEMWAGFDAECYVTEGVVGETMADYNLFRTANWKLGSYYGNAVHGGTDRRHAIFPCEKDDTFTFDFSDEQYGLWIYYYDEKGEIADFGYTTVTKDTELKITEKNGKVPTELRISVYPVAGGNITAEMWSKFNITCTKSSNHIKVATMNYGLWNDGATKFVEDSKVDTVLAAWKKMLDDNDVDILAGQEWLRFFDRSNTMTAEDALFAYKYRYQFSTATGFGKNLVSKTAIENYVAKSFTKNKDRQYTKSYTTINGKKVCLINAHCSLETNFSINRKAEFEELIRIMDQEKYVIVFGDFNAYNVSEFNLFKKAGYSVANGGEFGTFDTWTNFDKPSSWKNKAIDNIIVSPNIEILDVKVDRRDLSDHNMLIADIRLLDKAPEKNPGTSDLSADVMRFFTMSLISLGAVVGYTVFRKFRKNTIG